MIASPQASRRDSMEWLIRASLAYEVMLAVLALAVVWLLTLPEEGWVQAANWGIWAVFAIDYAVRLARSHDRSTFVKTHIPELLAAFPLEPFRVFRLFRLARLIRAGAVLWRVTRNLRRILDTNGLGYVLLATSGVIVIGAAAIRMAEPDMGSYADALWWAVVTATTVGYGDISPTGPVGRLIALCLMLVGIGTIGMITGSIATYFIRDKSRSLDPDIQHIRERLAAWGELSQSERLQLASMLRAITVQQHAS